MDQFDTGGTELRVYLRDLIDGDLTVFPAEAWLQLYAAGITEAVAMQQQTLGGTIAITGTPEQGRITINDADHAIILVTQWWTVLVDAARNPVPESASDRL